MLLVFTCDIKRRDIIKLSVYLVSLNCFCLGSRYVYTYVCMSVRQAIKNYSRKNEVEITNKTSPIAFQFPYMILAIDIIDGWALVTKHIVNSCQEQQGICNVVLAIIKW